LPEDPVLSGGIKLILGAPVMSGDEAKMDEVILGKKMLVSDFFFFFGAKYVCF
jgi:hypothetical protein